MDVNGNINSLIEDAIINTYFECELMNTRDKMQKLDERNFNSSFKKRIAKKINECLDKNISITLEALKMVDSTKGTRYEDEMIFILAQNPLTPKMASDYNQHLAEKRIVRELKLSEVGL
jgi:hypothetical protein